MKTEKMAGAPVCALAGGYPYINKALEDRGYTVLEVQPHPALPEVVSRHADLQLHPLGGGEVLAAAGCGLNEPLRALGFAVTVSALALGAEYPRDVPLCCFALGGRLYCHPAHTAPELLARFPAEAVRQGYTRCSSCVVDDGGIITADGGIAAAARKNGLDALQIRPGSISLPGYDYGFIGGCCGLIDTGVLAFSGCVDTHPDGKRIREFCGERGVEVLCLTDGELLDLGGILLLQ